MAEKDKSPADAEQPTKVLITAEQPPVPVVVTAPDGVTPVPIPSMGIEANTSPGASGPVPGYTPDAKIPGAPPVAAPTSQATLTPQAPPEGTPINVTVVAPPTPAATVTKGEGTTLTPTTTEAEDTTTEGQRRVNLIWELTQSGISVLITGAIVYCAVFRIPSDNLANAFFLIIGFYFSRTNHQAIGGIGSKPSSPYIGRIL